MPTLEQHKNKYNQNILLLKNELNITSCTNYDWIAIVSFYAALHLIEGKLAKVNIHSTTHVNRNTWILRDASFMKIRSQYKTLYDRSIAARYSAGSLNKNKAELSLQLLADIEKEISI